MVTGQTEKIADLFRALPEGVTYTTYEYDRFGNVTKATDSLGKSVTSEYNLMGLPKTQTDRNGISTYNQYNAYGSVLMSSTTNDADITWNYTKNNLVLRGELG